MVFEDLVKLIFVRLDNFSKQSENLFLLSKNTAGFEDFYFSGILHILNHCRSRQCRKKKALDVINLKEIHASHQDDLFY